MNAPFDIALQFAPYHDQMATGWIGWAGLLWMVVFALLLAAVVFAVVRVVLIPVIESTEPDGAGPTVEDPAESTLRERFARGEIDEEEYERRLAVLSSTDTR